MQRAQQGDVAAFEALYRQTHRRIYGLCLGMAGDASVAEDLTQQAFIRGWQQIGTFRGEARFSTWMHRLAVNVALNDKRSHARRIARVTTAETPTDTADVGRRPGLAMDIERAVAALPPRARQVFVLHDIEGYRHTEIAALMGLAEGTCRAQLFRARTLLREALAP